MRLRIRDVGPADRRWIQGLLRRNWGSTTIVSRGHVHHGDRLPGLVAVDGASPVGLLTYNKRADQLEIVSLNAEIPNQGVGTALIDEIQRRASAASCRRVWLITTNDNRPAMRFYERRGFRRVAVHRDAVEHSRKLKPGIPLVGVDGIPIRDEIEYELPLS